MSSKSQNMLRLPDKEENGEINYPEVLLKQMAKLCMSEEYSDITFEILNEKIPAHLVILAARSVYFRALLFGGLAESKQKVIQLQVPLEAFKALLTYIYSGHLSLSEMRKTTIFDTLGLVNQYGITELESSISEYLRQTLSLDNVCTIFDTARMYGLEALQNVCYIFLDTNANIVLAHESFKNLSEEGLKDILRRDSFFAPEVKIFTAVCEWCKHNPKVPIESLVPFVRLSLMTLEELFTVVRYSGILDSILMEALNEKATSTSLSYRGALRHEENVATDMFGALVTEGECGSVLLNGDIKSYSLTEGYARHMITENNDSGIIVELGSITIINHIKLLLLDRDSRFYSYFVDVSVDKKQWKRVVDHQSYHCRSWQFLYFSKKAVRYIKLVGSKNSVNKMFEVVALEAYYTAKIPKMVDGVVEPTKNVATLEMSAVVIAESNSSPNILLNGTIDGYNDASGYTFHKIDRGSIVVRLGQPYVIGSMRLLLWDCDDRNFSFYIETSINQKDWEIVVDKQNEACRSWQNLVFEPKAVVFIKIVGTRNTANSHFRCVHFECPSQDLKSLDGKQIK